MLVTICTSLSSLFPGHQFINLWLTAEKHSGSDFMPCTLRRRMPQLQDQNNSLLSQLFTRVSFPASSATTLRWIRCPSVPFQPGTLCARCHRTATTPTLGRRSPEREEEAFPPPHTLILSAPAKLRMQQAQAACNQELFPHSGTLPINRVEAQPEVEMHHTAAPQLAASWLCCSLRKPWRVPCAQR